MDPIVINNALLKLFRLMNKVLNNLPLTDEDKLLYNLAAEMNLDQGSPCLPTPENKQPSPRDKYPAGFQVICQNEMYATLSNGRYKIRCYKISKFPGHLAKILIAFNKEFGRYDSLKKTLDQVVGVYPQGADLDKVLEWVEAVANHLKIGIRVYSSSMETPRLCCSHDRVQEMNEIYSVYYDDNQFYYLVSIK